MGISIMQGRWTLVALGACLVACLSVAADASAGPIVNFGAPTSVASASQMANVVTGDFNGDGDPDLIAAQDFNDAQVLVGGAGSSFTPGPVLDLLGARDIVVGEFNGDSDPDIAVTNNAGVQIMVGTGASAATFSAAPSAPAGSFPVGLTVGQFNGDSDPDLAVTNLDTDTVSILTGTGAAAATFSAPSAFTVGEIPSVDQDRPFDVVAGDFNADGDPDLAVTNGGPLADLANDTVSILTGTGPAAATFATPSTNVAVGDGAHDIRVAEVNADSDPDLVVGNGGSSTGGPTSTMVLTGGGGAGFTVATTLSGQGESVAVGDFNADGEPDIASGAGGTNQLSIYIGGAGAAFGTAQNFAGGPAVNGSVDSIAVANFNGDAVPDIATANFSAGVASTLLNISDLVAPNTTVNSGPTGLTNDSTPTFTFSSNEGGPNFECRVLPGGSFAPCTSGHTTAAQGEGAHTFEVRAVDGGGNVDGTPATRSFTVDTVAPQTTIDTGPAGPTNDPTPTFGFSSSEGGSTFQCRVLPGGSFAPCTSAHTTAAQGEGAHTFEVLATDAAGNTDASAATRSFTVDTIAPQTTIDTGPAGPTNDPTPTFEFSSSESGSSFQCKVIADGGLVPCTSAHTTVPLLDGSYNFEVLATDAAGNVDQTAATRSFTVDTVAPQTTIISGPTGVIGDSTPTFGFSSSEGGTFQCRVLPGGSFAPCTSEHTTAPLADGERTFEVQAIDPAGNTDGTADSRSFTVDTGPPETAVDSGPSGPTNDPTPTFAFSANEGGASFECQVLPDGQFEPCTSAHTTAALSDGPHTFEVRATDAVDNLDTSPASRSFTVDTAPPQTTVVAGPSGETDDSTPTFSFASSEGGSTFQCRVIPDAFSPCTSPYTAPPLAAGAHTFEVRTVDAAGNPDPVPESRSFTVSGGGEPPVVLPPPILAKTTNVEPKSGEVFVSVPVAGARAAARAAATVPGLKGRTFVPLSEARQIPIGSLLDTRKGTVAVTSGLNAQGTQTQSGQFSGGVFQVLQSRKARGLTELRLKGASFKACGRPGRGKGAQAAASRRIRRLRGSARGRFRTRGRHSAATVRGTVWTVTDRCDGTLTKVTRGRVAVRDFRRRKTIVLRSGRSYLARARR